MSHRMQPSDLPFCKCKISGLGFGPVVLKCELKFKMLQRAYLAQRLDHSKFSVRVNAAATIDDDNNDEVAEKKGEEKEQQQEEENELTESGSPPGWSLALSPDWSAVTQSWLTTTSVSRVQAVLLPQLPRKNDGAVTEKGDISGVASSGCEGKLGEEEHVFLLEMRSHQASQADLELLGSNYPPASASQSVGINLNLSEISNG
ncbi:putative uncharacterized protein SPANXA2-OT1, partial [Plecturocebus cupreus]